MKRPNRNDQDERSQIFRPVSRAKQLKLYIKELEFKRDQVQVRLDYARQEAENENAVQFFSIKYLEKQYSDVTRVINTLTTILGTTKKVKRA